MLHVCPPCPDYKTPISGDCFDLIVQDVGICGVKCCILLTCFVYKAKYDLEILLFFVALNSFLTFFVFLVKISRLYSFIENKFSKFTKLKMSHPKGSL